MSFFIEKIFAGNSDELVHLIFQKFSRGKFEDRALVKAKKSKDKFTIGTTNEYANDFVRTVAQKLGDTEVGVKGAIVSTKNLKEDPQFNKLLAHCEVKQFMGIKQFKIDQEMSGTEILAICESAPAAFMALSFKTDDTELKIKPKAPKSAKPPTKGDKKMKADFCKIKTTDRNIAKGLLFDVDLDGFKDVEINHTYLIEDISLPEGEQDPLKIRELAKRKGKIVRRLMIDGNEKASEKEFVA